MKKQGEMLMKTLGAAVSMLDSTDKLAPILQSLGRRHVSYGVTADMYPSVGEALLLTLDKGLGEECTPETKAAWGWVLGAISGICIEAAKEVDPTYGESKKEKKKQPEAAPSPAATIITVSSDKQQQQLTTATTIENDEVGAAPATVVPPETEHEILAVEEREGENDVVVEQPESTERRAAVMDKASKKVAVETPEATVAESAVLQETE